MIASLQQAQLQCGTQSNIGDASQNSSEVTFKNHATNPAISALVTSLMNSANQFQHQQQVAGLFLSTFRNLNSKSLSKLVFAIAQGSCLNYSERSCSRYEQ